MNPRWIVALLGANVLACGAPSSQQLDAARDTAVDDVSPVSYRAEIQPIWNRWCVSCHSWDTGPGAINHQRPRLDSGESYRALLNAQGANCFSADFTALDYVVPSRPDLSAIVAITGRAGTANRCQSDRGMPKNIGPLEDLAPQDFALIRRWVAEGARNN